MSNNSTGASMDDAQCHKRGRSSHHLDFVVETVRSMD